MARLWSLKFRLGLSGVPADRRAWGLEALRHTCSVPAEGAVRCVTVCVCEWHLLSVQAESRRLPRTRPEGTGADARLVLGCTEPSQPAPWSLQQCPHALKGQAGGAVADIKP